jgi:hypothetical protein
MSKKTDYTTLADGCLAKAAEAKGEARLVLLGIEAGWRRLALACFDTAFGPEPVERRTPPRLRLARAWHR